jgi:hypothetical protein
MIYLLTANRLSPGGRCTVHIYTQTIHRTTQNKQYIEQHKMWVQHKIWEQYKKWEQYKIKNNTTELYLPPNLVNWEQRTKERQTVLTNWPGLCWNLSDLVWSCVISIHGKSRNSFFADILYQGRHFRIFFYFLPTKFMETQKILSSVDTHESLQRAL